MKVPFSLFLIAIITMFMLVATSCQQNQTATNGGQTPAIGAPGGTATPLRSNTPTAVTPASPTPGTAASPAPNASPTASANDAAIAAVQAVINKANDEQQQAFAKNDPTIMQDTATADYYNQLVQTSNDLANAGVTGFKLLNTEWGAITFPDATTAKATTYETWETTFSDGSTDQSTDENDYTLVLDQGVWKIQADNTPNTGPSIPPNL